MSAGCAGKDCQPPRTCIPTDDFTKCVDALVYYIDPETKEMKIAMLPEFR